MILGAQNARTVIKKNEKAILHRTRAPAGLKGERKRGLTIQEHPRFWLEVIRFSFPKGRGKVVHMGPVKFARNETHDLKGGMFKKLV